MEDGNIGLEDGDLNLVVFLDSNIKHLECICITAYSMFNKNRIS